MSANLNEYSYSNSPMSFLFPLKLLIPTTIAIVAAVIIPLSVFLITPVIESQNEETLTIEANHAVTRLKNSLEYFVQKQDVSGVQRELALNVRPEDIKQLIVFSAANIVLFSSRTEQIGESHTNLVDIHISTALIDKVQSTKETVHFYNRQEQALYTLASINLFNSVAQQGTEQGVLLLEMSAKGVRSETYKELQVVAAAIAAAIVLLTITLTFVLNRIVTSRISQLVLATKSFSNGSGNIEVWTGNDELGELGRAFKRMELRISASHSQQAANADLLDELFENSPSLIIVRDKAGRYLRANNAYLKFMGGVELDDLLGHFPSEFLPGDVAQSAMDGDEKVLETGQHFSSERTFKFNSKIRTFYYERFPLFDDEGAIYGVCTIATDMTERAAQEKELRLARYIFETTHDGIIVTDQNNLIVDANPAFESVTGYRLDEVVGKAPNILNSHNQSPSFYESMWRTLDATGIWSGEIWNRKKSGEIYPEWLTVKSILDEQDNVSGYFGVFTDITEQKKTEDSLRNLAYYDSLTNLANRTLCQERLNHDMELSDRHQESLALVFIDLDFFKHVNDSLGHEYGDQLLIEAARRIQEQVRRTDTVVRWGGDEFILILPGIFEGNMALVIASNVLDALKKPFNLKNTDVYIGASIGIAVYPNDASDAKTLIQHADAAMYSAKSKGRDQICFFDPELNRKNIELIEIKSSLRNALENNELEIYYQPKVCLESRQIIGLEALLRWNSSDKGQISPADFIPVAENSGFIVPIGSWVISQVCSQIVTWLEKGLLVEGQRVSVNLSPKQLTHPDLIPHIQKELSANREISDYLSFEITETAVIENVQKALPILQKLREQGLQIELDDFGSGYSSLNYLRRLPVDILKVDKTFIAELADNVAEQAIMATIIQMAHTLNIQVVAEGVETHDQLNILEKMACDKAQGFLFARPLPYSEVERLLSQGINDF